MNSFCNDEFGNLIYKIVDEMDYTEKTTLEFGLEEAKFEPIQGTMRREWIFPNTKDLRKKIRTIKDIIEFHEINKIPLDVCEDLREQTRQAAQDDYSKSVQKGLKIKEYCPVCDKRWDEHSNDETISCQNSFKPEISSEFKRKLQRHQKLSVAHLLAVSNGANFSVPGSGKTTITYAVLSKWLEDKIIDKILVIGPIASFGPWEKEYEYCFGKTIKSKRVRGFEIANMLPHLDHDLFLMHYTTASMYMSEILEFLNKYNVALIIDESHSVKSPKIKTWARTVISIAANARRRMILTGTPMPNDAQDLWTQLTFLWPHDYPLGNNIRYCRYAKNHGIGERYRDVVKPLFTRITKKDLGLPDVKFEPVHCPLMPIQKQIYNVIAAKTLLEINDLREQGKLQKFRAAKMIRLLQAASNPSLLHEKADEFEIDGEAYGLPGEKFSLSPLKNIDESIYEKIINYSKCGEFPSKITEAAKLTRKLLAEGRKVVVWCSFIDNMTLFEEQVLKDTKPIIIHGDISKDLDDAINREKLINEFKEDPNPRVLVASTAALSEAISLHVDIKIENGVEVRKKVCSDAIYLDRNFNGAQFMQSMDRIHRLGMDDKTTATYYCLIADGTIDNKIHERLYDKYLEMGKALDDPWIQQLDYDGTETKINEKQLGKDFEALVQHLREITTNDNNNS